VQRAAGNLFSNRGVDQLLLLDGAQTFEGAANHDGFVLVPVASDVSRRTRYSGFDQLLYLVWVHGAKRKGTSAWCHSRN
jgi:hypothetical protein